MKRIISALLAFCLILHIAYIPAAAAEAPASDIPEALETQEQQEVPGRDEDHPEDTTTGNDAFEEESSPKNDITSDDALMEAEEENPGNTIESDAAFFDGETEPQNNLIKGFFHYKNGSSHLAEYIDD